MQTLQVKLPYLPNILDIEEEADSLHGEIDGVSVTIHCTPQMHRDLAQRVRDARGEDVKITLSGEMRDLVLGPRSLRVTGRG